jgi:hypothetical protein
MASAPAGWPPHCSPDPGSDRTRSHGIRAGGHVHERDLPRRRRRDDPHDRLFQCGGDCLTPIGATWNGHWLADVDPRTGLAMIVLRDPSMTSPVDFTVNNDTSSGSNPSSFVLLQPSGGWKAPVTEVEYLCFADLTSWPQAMRDAAALPAGCGP